MTSQHIHNVKAEQEHTSPVGHPALAPVYEDVVPVYQGEAKKNATEIKLQDLEMKKNIAYAVVLWGIIAREIFWSRPLN